MTHGSGLLGNVNNATPSLPKLLQRLVASDDLSWPRLTFAVCRQRGQNQGRRRGGGVHFTSLCGVLPLDGIKEFIRIGFPPGQACLEKPLRLWGGRKQRA